MRRLLFITTFLALGAVALATNVIPGPAAPPNGSITTTKLADGAVTTVKLASGAVGTSQLATGAVTDATVASAAAIARSKLAAGTANALVTDDGTGALSALACTAGQIVVASATPAPACVSMSGDATIASNGAITLASSGVTAAGYGDASHVASVTFDAKGRATAAASTSIAIAESQVTSLTADLSAKLPTSGGTLTGPTGIEPTTNAPALTVRQTSYATPSTDVLDVTNAPGTTTYLSISSSGAATFSGTVSASSFNGNATSATSATSATTATNFSGSLAGDVTGTQSATVVGKLQGSAVASSAPVSGDPLVWSGTQWVATGVGGDLTGAYSALTVGKLQGRTVSATAPASGNSLIWNSTTSDWEPGTPSTAASATNFTGSLAGDVTGTQGATVVGAIRGISVSTTAPTTTGQALVYTPGTPDTWAPGSPTLGPATLSGPGPATTNYALASTDVVVPIDATTGSLTITLPVHSSGNSTIVYLLRVDATANTVTVSPQTGGTCAGAASCTIAAGGTLTLVSAPSNTWIKVAST